NKYLNIKYNDGSTWKLRNNRLLKNDGPKSETGENSKSDNITLPGEQNILKDNTGSPEIYAKINKDTTNSMYAYIKKLEQGYHNKKGLKRLDCLYEKKLFNEMYKLDKIAGNMKSKNSYFKKVIWKRYGLRFIVFLIVILFGITSSILCNFGGEESGNIKCDTPITTGSNTGNGPCSICKYIHNIILGSNGIIYFPLVIAFFSFIIYTMSKVRKYRRLKKRY
ncbi:Plasmodium exported protein, unknown function, partial [Plasmodium vivax]